MFDYIACNKSATILIYVKLFHEKIVILPKGKARCRQDSVLLLLHLVRGASKTPTRTQATSRIVRILFCAMHQKLVSPVFLLAPLVCQVKLLYILLRL